MRWKVIFLLVVLGLFFSTSCQLGQENARLTGKVAELIAEQQVLQGEIAQAQASIVLASLTAKSKVQASTTKNKVGFATAYSCDKSMSAQMRMLNCPNGITATGTVPKHKKTGACAKENIGKKFYIETIGAVTCEDTGGAIKGIGRFDIYMDSYAQAIAFGGKRINYWPI
jgi:3D (Asp-Asp-Asp) domain-containing protein